MNNFLWKPAVMLSHLPYDIVVTKTEVMQELFQLNHTLVLPGALRWVSRDPESWECRSLGMPELWERGSSCSQPDWRRELLLVPRDPGQGTHATGSSAWVEQDQLSSGSLWVKSRKSKRRKGREGVTSPLPFLDCLCFNLYWVDACSWHGQRPRCQCICQPPVTMLSRLSFLIIFSQVMVLIL